MARVISVEMERFPIAGTFTISRGSKTEAEVITVTIADGGRSGRGECVPYKRYGETMEGVYAAIEVIRDQIAGGIDRTALLAAMPAGAARNAIDCALWDLEAKLTGKPVAAAIGVLPPKPLETAYTLSLAEPEAMAAQARANAARPLLKVKIGGDNDMARIRAVTEAAPESRIILDANEGWTDQNVEANLAFAAQHGITLIEQPLPAD
ncbi:MAG: dipeptide epimerase, partial [Mesorhizobium sp.]